MELRKMPKDAVPAKYDYVFVYKKNNVKKEMEESLNEKERVTSSTNSTSTTPQP